MWYGGDQKNAPKYSYNYFRLLKAYELNVSRLKCFRLKYLKDVKQKISDFSEITFFRDYNIMKWQDIKVDFKNTFMFQLIPKSSSESNSFYNKLQITNKGKSRIIWIMKLLIDVIFQ